MTGSRKPLVDYDYVVSDINGKRKVKNGIETPISEHEWHQMNREHNSDKCGDCIFVPSLDDLLLYKVSRELREEASEKPYYLGKFVMPKWTNHSDFYMFKCVGCNAVRVDYPHGYTSDGVNNGLLYLRCNNCQFQVILYDKNIYQRLGMEAPPNFWKSVLFALKLRWKMRKSKKRFSKEVAQIEDMGIKVVVNPKARDLEP